MTVNVEVGKYYLDGYGEVQGPIRHTTNNPYIFEVQNSGRTFTQQGWWRLYGRHSFDLFSECNADGSPIAAPAPAIDPKRYALLEELAKAVEESLVESKLADWKHDATFYTLLRCRDALRTPPPKHKVYTIPEWDKMSAEEYNKFREDTARWE